MFWCINDSYLPKVFGSVHYIASVHYESSGSQTEYPPKFYPLVQITVRHDGSAHYLLSSLCSESVGLFQASQLMSQNIVYAQTLKADVFIFPGTNP